MGERFYPEDTRLADMERRLDALERSRTGGFSADGTTTFLRGGRDLRVVDGDVVIDGGQLLAVSGTTTRTQLDRDRLRLNRADGSRQVEVTPAGGLRVYAANGTTLLTTIDGDKVQVGSDVVLDSAGLKISGVLQRATLVDARGDSAISSTSAASFTAITSVTHPVPSGVTSATVMAIHAGYVSTQDTLSEAHTKTTIGGQDGVVVLATSRAGGADFIGLTAAHTRTISNPGSSITVQGQLMRVNHDMEHHFHLTSLALFTA